MSNLTFDNLIFDLKSFGFKVTNRQKLTVAQSKIFPELSSLEPINGFLVLDYKFDCVKGKFLLIIALFDNFYYVVSKDSYNDILESSPEKYDSIDSLNFYLTVVKDIITESEIDFELY